MARQKAEKKTTTKTKEKKSFKRKRKTTKKAVRTEYTVNAAEVMELLEGFGADEHYGLPAMPDINMCGFQSQLDTHIETGILSYLEFWLGHEAWNLYGMVGWALINRGLLHPKE